MKEGYALLALIGLSWLLYGCGSDHNTYPDHLDQKLPENIPQLFAPAIVNTDSIEINTVYNATHTELFFTRIIDGRFVIHHTELINNQWTNPEAIEMYADKTAESVAIDPSVTQDGETLYFLGISPEDRAHKSPPDIYKSQKIHGQWQLATKVGPPVSTDEYAESYPVVVADGSLYFTSDRPGGLGKRDIYRAQYLGDGKFDTPENIGGEVNTEKSERSTYVSPDEQYLITGNNHSEDRGFAISYKEKGRWKTPVYFDLGEPMLEDWIYFCPYMSPDGKYFFFSRRRSDPPESGWKGVAQGEVYWMEAQPILNLSK